MEIRSRTRQAADHAKQIKGSERRRAAAILRGQGLTFQEIGARLGIKHSTAHRLVGMSKSWVAEMSEDERALVLARPSSYGPDSPQNQALELRKRGWPYSAIATELQIDSDTARVWVMHELERLDADEARSIDKVRRLELERLDALLEGLWRRATKGEIDAVNAVLRVMERRSKLLGLDAPIKVDIEQHIRSLAVELEVDADELIREAQLMTKEILRKNR